MGWTVRPLRFWITVGMIVALAPLAVSAVAGYLVLHQGVIAPFHDVSVRERSQAQPLQHLRILIWDTLIPVDEFVDEGGAGRPQAYRELRARIESEFAGVRAQVAGDPAARILVERASDHWTAADEMATELVSVERPPGDAFAAQLMERYHGQVAATSDTLGEAYSAIAREIEADHDLAMRAFERSVWLAGIAAGISLLAMISGVVLIGRVMAVSVDRLVEGAARFAAGDRDHRIDIRVPPELKKVADEFNRMIARIHDSEAALADIARRDGLTRLLNRRAFDEALADMHARMRRGGGEGALMTMDLDHFKQINDRHGHGAGDEVLRVFARRLTSALRPTDHAYRVGGEEFAVLFEDTDLETARTIAERVRESVAGAAVKVEGAELPVTVSIGLAKACEAASPEMVVEAADAALYRAKTTGRNRVTLGELGPCGPAGGAGNPAKLTA